MATKRFYSQTNAETHLLGYIAWQWDRYLVLQNYLVHVVLGKGSNGQRQPGVAGATVHRG